MKLSFRLHKRRPLTRSEAWGCFTANLALPGSGSLVGGHPVGYAQLASSFLAFGLFTYAGFQFIRWYLLHWDQLTGPASLEDPVANLMSVFHALKFPAASVLFVLANILWALVTSYQILRETPKTRNPLPPRLF